MGERKLACWFVLFFPSQLHILPTWKEGEEFRLRKNSSQITHVQYTRMTVGGIDTCSDFIFGRKIDGGREGGKERIGAWKWVAPIGC